MILLLFLSGLFPSEHLPQTSPNSPGNATRIPRKASLTTPKPAQNFPDTQTKTSPQLPKQISKSNQIASKGSYDDFVLVFSKCFLSSF